MKKRIALQRKPPEREKNYAIVKDAQIRLRGEECAEGMGQSATSAAKRDAQIMLSKEECASGMGQRSTPNDAAVKDAQILSPMEECA